MHGTFPIRFQEVVAPFVRGVTVLDLGAGDGERTKVLRSLGADRVVAVDKLGLDESLTPSSGMEYIEGYFDSASVQKLARSFEGFVAHVAWPQNCQLPGLVDILRRASVVIYVGCCTGGTFCGNQELFDYLRMRGVLAYEPELRNTLTVYGGILPEARMAVTYEEWAAYSSNMAMFSDTKELRGLPMGWQETALPQRSFDVDNLYARIMK